jgi:hypothetical protein
MKKVDSKFYCFLLTSGFFALILVSCIFFYSKQRQYAFLHDMSIPSVTHLLEQTMNRSGYQVVERGETNGYVRGEKTSGGKKHSLAAWLGKSRNVVIVEGYNWKDVDPFLDNINEVAKNTLFSAKAEYHEKNSDPMGSLASQKQPPGDVKVSDLRPAYTQIQGWAVIIGISEYKYSGRNDLTNLIFADDDAKAFARVLRNLGWSESHMKLLVNEEATQRNTIIALESWLTKAGPDDQVVLFWAGHGFPDPEDPEKVYFACYDTDISIPATGYRMDRVRAALEERRTRNVVVFADTCHAGKLITRGERGISIMPKIDQMRRENRIPKGWIFMVGADTDRKAIEHTSWTNGAFTHCLLNALSGKADGYMSSGANDGVVTMGELRTYMNSVMPDETQKVIGVAKRPVITTSTGDPEIWNLTLQAR